MLGPLGRRPWRGAPNTQEPEIVPPRLPWGHLGEV
jgi:hypothetical protein